ncbi:MAG TPA: hypothetical protein VFM82_06900 [Flavobacteriaceae bacterium]|nr:hypothetical protein [Flavobacteriaceae bacterium]
MKTYKIKTHRKGSHYQTSHFYVLNKGKNAGRPSKKPYCNSFVVFANNELQTEKLFWICNILHQGDYFKPYLVGSRMEYIHIGSVKKLFDEALKRYYGNHWEERFKVLQRIEKAERDLKRQADNIRKHKILLMRSYERKL